MRLVLQVHRVSLVLLARRVRLVQVHQASLVLQVQLAPIRQVQVSLAHQIQVSLNRQITIAILIRPVILRTQIQALKTTMRL